MRLPSFLSAMEQFIVSAKSHFPHMERGTYHCDGPVAKIKKDILTLFSESRSIRVRNRAARLKVAMTENKLKDVILSNLITNRNNATGCDWRCQAKRRSPLLPSD